MRIKTSIFVFVFLFSLVACSQKPVFTFKVLTTETPPLLPVESFPNGSTAIASPSPLPTLTFTPTAAIPPGFSLSPALTFTARPITEMPSDFSPILYGKKYDANTFFILLGGWQGQGWLTSDLAFTRFANLPGWEYDIYSLNMGKFQIRGNRPEFSPAHKIYTVGTSVTVDDLGMVGVAKGWPVLQRDVQEFSSDSEVYGQIALDWLVAQGIAAPEAGTLHVFRVDLEGDGVDEIFISATHLENQHMAKSGDYSIILMRKVQGNDAVTLPIVAELYRSQDAGMTFPRTYSLGNFLDLNQDGILEVIVDIQRWDGDGAVIYEVDGQNIRQVPCNMGWACDDLPGPGILKIY